MTIRKYELHLPALEIRQGPGKVLYSFAIDGKLLPSFTTISRIGRGDGNEVHGYQRPEVPLGWRLSRPRCAVPSEARGAVRHNSGVSAVRQIKKQFGGC